MNKITKSAFTLIELLVVISILTVVTAMVVPQLRIVTKDRNIREASRVVGSIFAEAIQRAKNDGASGVIIERNPNFTDPSIVVPGPEPLQFAGSAIYLMHTVPPFSGDELGDRAWVGVASPNNIVIKRPYEHDESAVPPRHVIRVNDHIHLNYRNFGYRILSVVEFPPDMTRPVFPADWILQLTVDLASYPAPPAGGPREFRIERQPRKLHSSRVDLPRGHMVDLRYSGEFDDLTGTNTMYFTQTNEPIRIFFDPDGRCDRVYFGNELSGAAFGYVPRMSLSLFVTQDELDLTPGQDQLMDPDNLWVTVNDRNGNVNVGYSIAQPAPSPPLFVSRLNGARGLSGDRKAATQ